MKGARTPIFLLSPPRSGSTLVQRVLGAHAEIATVSEPWILLAPLYALREGSYAEYRHFVSRVALEDFCRELPGGRDDYLQAIREMALYLYSRAGGKAEARYFLDKTPSYTLVVDDIIRAFPDAKLIFLWRNPLAIIASEVATFRRNRWRLHCVRVQLYEGIANLVAAWRQYADRGCAVQYERLVTEPAREWSRLFSYLELAYDPDVLTRFAAVELRGRVQDSMGVRRYATLSREPLEKWKTTLASPIRRTWCRHYLQWLGAERLAAMGYELDTLQNQLRALSPNYACALPDFVDTIVSAGCELLEPRIYWDKLRAIVAGRRLYEHE